MCHLYPYNNVKLLRKFLYINICGFLGRGKFLYETRVLDNSYLQFKFKLPLVVSEIFGVPYLSYGEL